MSKLFENSVDNFIVNSLFNPKLKQYEEKKLFGGDMIVLFKGRYKDGSDHYEVTIKNR